MPVSKKKPVKKVARAKPKAKAKAKVVAAPRRKKAPARAARGAKAGKVPVLTKLKWFLGIGVPLIVVMAFGKHLTAPALRQVAAPLPEATQTSQAAPVAAAQTWGALLRAFSNAEHGNVSERIGFWSELLWRSPAASAKLTAIDRAPAIQDTAPLIPKEYDCTTYVETVASLARSRAPADFYRNLMSIRYRGGKATFSDRNHFPEADWIPNNVTAGILRDVTAEIGRKAGVEVGTATKSIDRLAWLQGQVKRGQVDRGIASVTERQWSQPARAAVAYLPADQVAKFVDQIPNGAIINLVHLDDPRHPVLISHQGFVIRKDGVVYFRHANPPGVIRNQKLTDYLRIVSKRRNWPVVGVNVNVVAEPNGA